VVLLAPLAPICHTPRAPPGLTRPPNLRAPLPPLFLNCCGPPLPPRFCAFSSTPCFPSSFICYGCRVWTPLRQLISPLQHPQAFFRIFSPGPAVLQNPPPLLTSSALCFPFLFFPGFLKRLGCPFAILDLALRHPHLFSGPCFYRSLIPVPAVFKSRPQTRPDLRLTARPPKPPLLDHRDHRAPFFEEFPHFDQPARRLG